MIKIKELTSETSMAEFPLSETMNFSLLHFGSSKRTAHCPAVGALSSHLSVQTPKKQRAEIWDAKQKRSTAVSLAMVGSQLNSTGKDVQVLTLGA